MIKEAFTELDSGHLIAEEELKYTQRLNLHPYESESGVRAGVLQNYLVKTRVIWCIGMIHTQKDMLKVKNAGRGKGDYSVKPEKINLEEYKNLLLKKLKDTLAITGFNNDLRQEKLLLSEHA